MSQWSQKLDDYLSKNQQSKRQLAEQLDISINTLDKWWRNREPSPEHAAKLRQLLHEDVSTKVAVADERPASPARETFRAKVVVEQPSTGPSKQGKRYEEKSVVVSLLRTTCPFCKKSIERFRHCPHCGQHLVWANVPVDNSS